MDLPTARHLMEKIRTADAIFAALSRDIDQLDKPERTEMTRGLGHTMAEMYFRLIDPIGRQHPSLDPARTERASK